MPKVSHTQKKAIISYATICGPPVSQRFSVIFTKVLLRYVFGFCSKKRERKRERVEIFEFQISIADAALGTTIEIHTIDCKKAKIKIGIVGISGRMGKSIAMAISKSSDVILAAGCEHKKHKDVGKDIGIVLGIDKPLS